MALYIQQYYSLFLVFISTVFSCNISQIELKTDINVIADVIYGLVNQLESSCTLTFTHDHQYHIYYDLITLLIADKRIQNTVIVTSLQTDTIDAGSDSPSNTVNATQSDSNTEYWFSWINRNADQQAKTNCGFHIIVGPQDKLPDLIEHVASKISFVPSRDYFFIWPQDDQEVNITSVLQHDRLENMKYKVLVTIDDDKKMRRFSFYSNCFFCNTGGRSRIVPVFEFRISEVLKINSVDCIFPDFTKDFNGKYMQGVFIDGFNYSDVLHNRKYYKPAEIMHPFMLDIGQKLNFRWDVATLAVGEAGIAEAQLDDGSWTGMVAEILYKHVDFSPIGPVTEKVIAVADYTRPYIDTYISFMTRENQPLYSWKVIIQPYTKDMWFGIFISSIVGAVTLYILLKCLAKRTDTFTNRPLTAPLFLYCLTYMFLTFIEENPEVVPTSHSSRTFLSLWWLFALVISCGYNAKLIGFLAVPEVEVIPESIKELAAGDKFKWGAKASHMLYYQMLIESSNLPFLWDIIPHAILFDTVEDCVRHANVDDFACVSCEAYLQQQRYNVMDKFGYLPVIIRSEDTIKILAALVLPKYSVITPIIDNIISYNYASGLNQYYDDHMHSTYHFAALIAARKLDLVYKFSLALRIQQLQGVFYGLGLGILAALIILISEIVHKKYNNYYSVSISHKHNSN